MIIKPLPDKTILVCSLLMIFFLGSCENGRTELLEKESLFTLNYGKMEDQIDVFHNLDRKSLYKDRIVMKDGIFYISNGNSSKIMEFNSYGDIINLFYNKDRNTQPVILKQNNQADLTSTRNVYTYPFIDIGEIAVSSKKVLFVDDRIIENRIEYDQELGVTLDRVILQFDKSGNFLDYLGQEGSGGTPFSYVDKILVTQRDELVVFTRNKEGWKIFWFSSQGKPIYTVRINSASLPFPSAMDRQTGFAVLETVDCDFVDRILYLKIDYYIDYSQVLETEETGIRFSSSHIWFLDVSSGDYSGSLDIPIHARSSSRKEVFAQGEEPLLYELIGTVDSGYFFLLGLDSDSRYSLMILDRAGDILVRRKIDLGSEKLIFRDFYVNDQGILNVLLGWEDRAEAAWWRTDSFIPREKS